jgi:hypothetical protein
LRALRSGPSHSVKKGFCRMNRMEPNGSVFILWQKGWRLLC